MLDVTKFPLSFYSCIEQTNKKEFSKRGLKCDGRDFSIMISEGNKIYEISAIHISSKILLSLMIKVQQETMMMYYKAPHLILNFISSVA